MAGAQSAMTPWQQFYDSIRDPSWPDCDTESKFNDLPEAIRRECLDRHGYQPGMFAHTPALAHRVFPIKTDTACQLKWNWSTIFLTTENTASCHRTNHHRFDVEGFDFHNTPSKLRDRKRMLRGEWPEKGCNYCRDIESAGGQSDRITNLDMPGMSAPPELDTDPGAVQVTPRILEVYFDNVCNLKCTYCGPHFSSLWDAENKQHGRFSRNGLIIPANFVKSPNIEQNKQRLFEWMAQHGSQLTNFNILGGEPLFQDDLDRCLTFFDQHPCPQIDLQIFTNLNARLRRVERVVGVVRDLIDRGHLRKFTITASLDCWGREQEYARFPLKLETWQENFEYLLEQDWISLVVGSTITPLTAHTLPDLVERINYWRQQREVHHYFNSVNSPSYMFIDIFGDLFVEDFQRALRIMPEDTPDQIRVKGYLDGIAQQSSHPGVNPAEVMKLWTFLEEMDRRRHTNWRDTFPWLVDPMQNILVDQKIKLS